MKRVLIVVTALFALLSPAFAADSSVPAMGNATSVAGTDGFYCIQSAGTVEHECTSAQMAAYIYGLMSGDATASGAGAITFATVNSNTGSFGSATNCNTILVNAKGLITSASQTLCTPGIANVTGLGAGVATALAIAPGTAGSFVTNGGALGTPSSGVGTNLTALNASNLASGTVAAARGGAGTITGALKGSGAGVVTQAACADLSNGAASCSTDTTNASNIGSGTLNTARLPSPFTSGTKSGSTSVFGTTSGTLTSGDCVKFDASGNLVDAGSACGSGSGAVSSVTGGCGVTVSPTTGATIVSAPVTATNNTGTTDTITSTACGTLITENNAASVAVAITTAGFVSTNTFSVKNFGAGVATYTPSSGTIDGAATLACKQNQSADIYFDGTNYKTLANTCGLGTLATVTPGTGVAAAAAVALSGAGGLTSTIASGTATLGTSAIGSGACATAVTVTAAGVATTDVVTTGFNGDPTATTGYLPTAMLTIVPYPTSGNVNFKVCNLTGSSITPSAVTLNWRVVR